MIVILNSDWLRSFNYEKGDMSTQLILQKDILNNFYIVYYKETLSHKIVFFFFFFFYSENKVMREAHNAGFCTI